MYDAAAKILRLVGVQNFMAIPNLSMVWSLEVKFSTNGPNKGNIEAYIYSFQQAVLKKQLNKNFRNTNVSFFRIVL